MTTVTAARVVAAFDSPLGPLAASVGPKGLTQLRFAVDLGADKRAAHHPVVATLADELDRYFSGEPLTFSTPVDLGAVSAFTQSVLRACAAIRYGTTSSYGSLAAQVGRAGAARAVGNALGANPVPLVVPCHRVVRGDGSLGGYGGGRDRKRFLLALEGGSEPTNRVAGA